MYISSGGGGGKGSAHPNQQSSSTTTTASAQQQNATLPQQIYQPNIQQVVMPPTFHPSYMPRQPTTQLYTSTPQIHFQQSQMPPSFAGYSYFFTNSLISTQHRPNIIQGGISHNPNALALPGVGVVPTNITTQASCQTGGGFHTPGGGGTAMTVKKRKHALAIIHPVTKKNVLDEFQMSKSRGTATDSKYKSSKFVESDPLCDQTVNSKPKVIQQQSQSSCIVNEIIEEKIPENKNLLTKDENSNDILHSTEQKNPIPPKDTSKNVNICLIDSGTSTKTIAHSKEMLSEATSPEKKIASKPMQKKADTNNDKSLSNSKEDTSFEEKLIKATQLTSSSKSDCLQQETKVMPSEVSKTMTQQRKFSQRTENTLTFKEKISTAPIEGSRIRSTVIETSKKFNIPKRKKNQNSESAEKRLTENSKKKNTFEEEKKSAEFKLRIDNRTEEGGEKRKYKITDQTPESFVQDNTESVECIDKTVDNVAKQILNSSNVTKSEDKIFSRKFDNESARSNENLWKNLDSKTCNEKIKVCNESDKPRMPNIPAIGNKVSPVIHYNDGQWSPSNPSGKKIYDINQLILLSHASQSRIKPKTNTKGAFIFLQSARPSPAPLNLNSSKSYKSNQTASSTNDNNILNLQSCSKSIAKSGINGKQSTKINKPGMIHVRLSLRENIKLNETENAWKPAHFKLCDEISSNTREKEELFRKIRGILNKLTPERFDTLLEEIMKLQIDTCDKINGVMMLVFEKAIDEPNFSASYARLCQRLADKNLQCEMDSEIKDAKIKASNLVLFKTALLDKTEHEFHDNVIDLQAKDTKLKPTIEQLKKCTDPRKKQELQGILEEQEYRLRRRSCGTVRFIGELFKMSMLTGNIIKACIYKLLDPKSEEKLECLCKLLTTVGKKFEMTSVGKDMKKLQSLDEVIKKMQNIVDRKTDSSRISNRVRFMLQDVIDLRRNKWLASRAESQFKTIDPGQTEQQSAIASLYNLSIGKKGEKQHESRSSSLKTYESENIGFHAKQGTLQSTSDEMWFKQTTKGCQYVDANKLRQIYNVDNPIKLGDSSQFMWRRGSTTTSSTESNTYTSTQGSDLSKAQRKHGVALSLDDKAEKGDCTSNTSSNSMSPISKSNSQGNLVTCKSVTLPKKIKSATVVSSATCLQTMNVVCSPTDITESDNKKVYDTLNKMVDAAIEESVQACMDIWMQIPKNLHWVLVYSIFIDYLHLAKTKPTTRKILSNIILYLLQKNSLQKDDFKKGYVEFFKIANEIVIDVPEAWKYIFEFIGGLIQKEIYSTKFFMNRCLFDGEMWKQFLKNFILYFTREIGPNYTRNLWKSSTLEWKDFDFLNESDIKKFVRDINFHFLEDKNIPPPMSSSPDIESIMLHVRELLESDASSDEVIDYLNGNIASISRTFVRNLTIAICECTTKCENGHYMLDQTLFQIKCVPLLLRYIDSKEERELECLSAMHNFATSDLMLYPDNFLTKFFSELYEAEIISQDSFLKWWHCIKEESIIKDTLILELSRFFSLLSDEGSEEN